MKQADPFYATPAWRKLRKERLELDHYMCAECMRLYEAGLLRRPRRASVVHHIQHLADRPDLALDLNNLESLCSWHHNQEHPEKGGRSAAEEARNGPRGMRVIKV